MNELIEWRRDPYYGGCAYHANANIPSVFGDYSPSNPIEFESDCAAWRVGRNGEHGTFATADEAMAVAESLA